MNPHDLALSLAFAQSQPKAAARELELQQPQIAAQWLTAIPVSDAKKLMALLLPAYTGYLSEFMEPETLSGLIEDLSGNHVTAVLRYTALKKRKALLEQLPDKKAVICRLLLNYSEDMVGAWMKADILMIPAGINVAQALQRLPLHHGYLNSDFLPIVDEGRHLLGQVSVKQLLAAKPGTPVAHLSTEVASVLKTRSSLVAAEQVEQWQIQDSIFVLNREQQLSGELRHADLRLALQGLRKHENVVGHNNNLLSSIGEAYGISLMALLGLIGDGLNQPKKEHLSITEKLS